MEVSARFCCIFWTFLPLLFQNAWHLALLEAFKASNKYIWSASKTCSIFRNLPTFFLQNPSGIEIFQSGWKWHRGTNFLSRDRMALMKQFRNSKWSSDVIFEWYALDITDAWKRWNCCIASWSHRWIFLVRIALKSSWSCDDLKKH